MRIFLCQLRWSKPTTTYTFYSFQLTTPDGILKKQLHEHSEKWTIACQLGKEGKLKNDRDNNEFIGFFSLLYLLTLTWRATDVLKQSSRVNSKTSKDTSLCPRGQGKGESCDLESVCSQGDLLPLTLSPSFLLPLSLSFSSSLRAVPVMDLHCQVMVAVKGTLCSHSIVPDFLWPYGLQHARPLCSSPSPEVCPSFHCIGDAIQPSHPLMPSSPSALNLSQHQGPKGIYHI